MDSLEIGPLDESRLLKWLKLPGFKTISAVEPPSLRRSVRDVLDKSLTLVRPRGMAEIIPAEVAQDAIRLGKKGGILDCAWLARKMESIDRVAIFIVTLGRALEAEIDRIKEKEITAAYLLNGAGGYLADLATRSLVENIAAGFAESHRATRRYAPGVGGWPLADLPRLVHLLGPAVEDIEISDALIMSPRFSTAGLVGLIPRHGDL